MTHDWTSATFRAALTAMVRRRVPPADAEDVVQAVLTEAVATTERPADPEGARKWLWGVARHKIADYHRRASRETTDPPERAAPPPEHEERALLRWAVGELPAGADAKKTFEWLLREGDGETLEAIAEEERLPPPVVRQRVSRLRRLFRSRWAQLAAAGLVALVAWIVLRRTERESPIAERPRPTLREDPAVVATRARARTMRDEASQAASQSDWVRCLERLDAARAIDPAGDEGAATRALRQRAQEAIERERAVPPAPVEREDGGVGDSFGNGGFGSTGSVDSMSWEAPRRRRVRRDGGVPTVVPESSM
jgi:RNA polymerase sigma factor (sigma-70 family)